jgi:hypothetical protein
MSEKLASDLCDDELLSKPFEDIASPRMLAYPGVYQFQEILSEEKSLGAKNFV